MARYRTTNDLSEEREAALRLDAAVRGAARAKQRTSGRIQHPAITLYFEIQGSDTLIRAELMDEVILGRRDPKAEKKPELDLTPHAAYQLGVSRRHAVIRLRDDYLEIFDLNSKNGTKVNGRLLQADTPAQLHNGDEIMIGRMTLRLILNK